MLIFPDASHRDFPFLHSIAVSRTTIRSQRLKQSAGLFILVSGGVKSGKSHFAVTLARKLPRRILYLASCKAQDREMQRRVRRHRRERPATWLTLDPPFDPVDVLAHLDSSLGGVILDCLTLYVSDLLMSGESDHAITRKVRQLCVAIGRTQVPVIVVTNEVGCGIVPEHPLGRRFRDLAGSANQIAAHFADQVVLMVSGIPLIVKGDTRALSTAIPSRNHANQRR